MLTKDEVNSVLVKYIPDDVEIIYVDLDDYIQSALNNPFIQKQIDVGIYIEDTLKDDFLSVACSYPALNKLTVSLDLINKHIDGVDPELTKAYLENMAIHEAHHFHQKKNPKTAIEHAHNELECIKSIREKYPNLDVQVTKFEAQSPVFQRVYQRMKALQGGR